MEKEARKGEAKLLSVLGAAVFGGRRTKRKFKMKQDAPSIANTV